MQRPLSAIAADICRVEHVLDTAREALDALTNELGTYQLAPTIQDKDAK